MAKLTKAFKDKKNEILFIAGDLGHYIADGHMLCIHSDNHDGQNTNQKEFTCGKVVCQSCLQRITSLTFLRVFI
jgi:hypothetical protein